MSYKFLFISFILILNSKCFGQPVLFLGAKAGIANSFIEKEGVLGDILPKYSFNGGLVGEFSFISNKTSELSRMTLIVEADYSKYSFHDNTYRGAEFNNNFDVGLYYAKMPVMMRFYTGFLGVKKTGIYFSSGFYGAYLFGATHEGLIVQNQVEESIDLDVLSDYLEYDYGIAFGGGLSMAGFIGIDFRYNIGLVDIYKNGNIVKINKSWAFVLHLAWPINYKEEY